MRYYGSVKNPSEILIELAEFCINLYFPSWFEIKRCKTITSGAKIFFNMINGVNRLSNTRVKNIGLHCLQINAFFAHPEMILIAMLGNDDSQIRNKAVNKIMQIRRDTATSTDNDFVGGFLTDHEDDEYEREQSAVSENTECLQLTQRQKFITNL